MPSISDTYADHRDELVRVARAELGDRFAGRIDASSIVQDVFADLVGREADSVTRGELRARVSHKVIDAIRKVSAKKRGLGRTVHAGQLGDANEVEVAAEEPTPSVRAMSREMVERLGELDEYEAAVVRAHYMEGRTYRETAAALAIPLGSVGKLLQTALAKLRRGATP